MPIYEYQCKSCCHSNVFPRFEEKIQSEPGVVDRPMDLFEMPTESMSAQYRRLDYIAVT